MYSESELTKTGSDTGNILTLSQAFRIVIARWRFVAFFAIGCAIMAAAFSLMIHNKYTAAASALPPNNDYRPNGILSLAEYAPGLDLGGLAGENRSPSLIYPEILQSRTLYDEILGKDYSFLEDGQTVNQNLYEYLEEDNPDRACKALEKIMSVDYDKKTGIVKVSVTTGSPELSSQIANYTMERLDEFNKNKRKSGAALKHQFIEKRLLETKKELADAEEELRDFRKNNRNYLQTSDPQILMEHERLFREVNVKAQVYQMLAQEKEMAAIQEKKETPVVQFLDTASPPTVKSKPSRRNITIIGFLTGLLLASCIAILEKRYPSGKEQQKVTRLMNRISLIRRAPEEMSVEH